MRYPACLDAHLELGFRAQFPPLDYGMRAFSAAACRARCQTAVGQGLAIALGGLLVLGAASAACGQGTWEITPQSEQALSRGLDWLARNQGPEGNWQSNDLGLVGTGMLAFLSAGHLPGRGPYGENVQRAMEYILRHAGRGESSPRRGGRPAETVSGLLNIAEPRRGMYNHGLATFALGQLYGMSSDVRLGPVLDRALKVICQTQCDDGGWDYVARRQQYGHDLSLAVMQALALRSAVDTGFEVPPETVELAIKSVREHYTPQGCDRNAPEEEQKKHPGRFTYSKGGGNATTAMAAAGVVCLQEFAQYDDWRIEKNIKIILEEIEKLRPEQLQRGRRAPFDAYTLWYVAQALYQVGGQPWRNGYPKLRDCVVASQVVEPGSQHDGMWHAQGHVSGRPGELYQTAVCCFVLAIPNRYLPILQEGRIDSLRAKYGRR